MRLSSTSKRSCPTTFGTQLITTGTCKLERRARTDGDVTTTR